MRCRCSERENPTGIETIVPSSISYVINIGCSERENPTGIETKCDQPDRPRNSIVAASVKTRQGLKLGIRIGNDITCIAVAASVKTRQGLKHYVSENIVDRAEELQRA